MNTRIRLRQQEVTEVTGGERVKKLRGRRSQRKFLLKGTEAWPRGSASLFGSQQVGGSKGQRLWIRVATASYVACF